MNNFLAQVFPQPPRINFTDSNVNTRNIYQQRVQFFTNLYQNDYKLQNIIQGSDDINQVQFYKARNFLRTNPQIPSLGQLKYYFLPALYFGEELYEELNAQNEDDLVQQLGENLFDFDEVYDDNQINTNPITWNIPNARHGFTQNPFPTYVRLSLSSLYDQIQQGFIQNKYEKVFFNLEVLYSDLNTNVDQQLNNTLENRRQYIRFLRAWSGIDTQIVQLNDNPDTDNYVENQAMVENEHFEYDPQNNTFCLNVNGGIENDNRVWWFKRHFNITFTTMELNNADDSDNLTVYMQDSTQNITNQEQVNLKRSNLQFIFSQIEMMDEYGLILNPIFLRSVDIYAIKRFTQNIPQNIILPQIIPLVPLNAQPYVLNNSIDNMLQDFLNGLSAFDFNGKYLNISKFDIINGNKDQHCLFRILYYFEKKLFDNNLSFNDFMFQILQYMEDNKYQQKDLSLQQQLFYGSVYALVQIIKQRFGIQLGIFVINSTRQLYQQQEYQLLIQKNHCILTNCKHANTIKKQLQYKKPYIMKNKDFTYKKKQKIQQQKQQFEDIICEQDKIEEIPEIFNYYIDTETYVINNNLLEQKDQFKGKQGIFLICLIDQDNNKIHFKDNNCIFLFLNYIENLLQTSKGKTINIWSFNGGKFDYLFLMIDIIQRFPQVQIIGTETDIKQIQIDNIYFKDIKYIFSQGSLNQQAKLWQLEVKKQDFDIKNWSYQDYLNEEKQIKVIEYCYNDCIVLKGIVDKFYQLVNTFFEDKNKENDTNKQIDLRQIFSSSSLTLNIFKQFYLTEDLKSNVNRVFYKIERESYYGGITLNFKREGQNLFYYDINSSYPNVMKNELIPVCPLKNNEQQYNICKSDFNNNDIISYYLYEVEVEFHEVVTITTLPIRTKEGLLYLKKVPLSWRWGCEIQFINKRFMAKSIKYHRYLEYKGENIFGEFIEDLYTKRLNEKREDLKQFYKNLMNGGYGKFGQKEFPTTEYVHISQIEEHIRNPLIKEMKQLNNQIYKIGYAQKDNLQFTGSLVRIASFITAKARCNLMEGVFTCGQENIYYADTDSIITSKQLPDNMIGNKLGQWKLETLVEKGIFIAPKIYYIKFDKPDCKGKIESMKCKGIRNEILNSQIFNQLKDNKYINLVNNGVFTRKFGAIYINDQSKLVRILDLKRKWINDLDSIPYNDIDEYMNDKQLKQEQNENLLIQKNLQKKYKGNLTDEQVVKKLQDIYKRKYEKIIQNDDIYNQKRKNIYLQYDCNKYIDKKINNQQLFQMQ